MLFRLDRHFLYTRLVRPIGRGNGLVPTIFRLHTTDWTSYSSGHYCSDPSSRAEHVAFISSVSRGRAHANPTSQPAQMNQSDMQ